MKQLVTKGIILTRTDFGEADRVITLLTPDHGKLRLMARGVRKIKSKLAGGIELFSVSSITFIQGRGEMGTLISTRLIKHYGNIVGDINRVQLGYELIKMLNRATEDEPETAYFDLLEQAFEALNDATISQDLIKIWFSAQLLRLAGHAPNLRTDVRGQALDAAEAYDFGFDDMAFLLHENGQFASDNIKFLRLIFGDNQPHVLQKIKDVDALVQTINQLVTQVLHIYIRT